MVVTCHVCMLYCCFDNYLAVMNIFISGKFKILKHRLQRLCTTFLLTGAKSCKSQPISTDLNAICEEFKNCVRQHQYLIWLVEEVESIYSFVNLCSVLTYSLIICLGGYQLVMVGSLSVHHEWKFINRYVGFQPGNSLIRRAKFVIFSTGCLTQLFSFSFNCNNVMVTSVDLMNGPYNTLWYEQNWCQRGRALTKDFMVMIMRCQRPCYLTAAGFFPVTLDTLKSVNRSLLIFLLWWL